MAVVREAFKPEFLNRLDEILVFHRLDREDLARIVELQVDRLAARLADRRLTLELTPAAKAWLADRGYDPAYGARPLRRLVAKAIGDELARRLLAGELGDGDTVVVDADGDKLTFTRRQPATVASS
jgi:ATP-dependent Clp protease ATP-binding subunit ClpB